MRTLSKRCSLHTDWRSRLGKTALLAPLSLALGVVVLAQGSARDFNWEELQKQGRLLAGVVLPPEPGSPGHRLKIENNKPGPSSTTILTIDRPQVTGQIYRLSGQVRYDNVEGNGYLELWNYFPGGGQYFSRTLAEQGPMMKISGSSGWRSFALPFDATGAPPPTRLVMNVVLQGRGTVYVGPLQLREGGGTGSGQLDEGPTGRLAGMIGGLAGALVGSIGALIGVLTSLGRARRFVLASATSLIAIGGLAFVSGIIALASTGWHSSLYALPLILGFVTSVASLGLLPVIRKRYEEIELRTMRAHDLG